MAVEDGNLGDAQTRREAAREFLSGKRDAEVTQIDSGDEDGDQSGVEEEIEQVEGEEEGPVGEEEEGDSQEGNEEDDGSDESEEGEGDEEESEGDEADEGDGDEEEGEDEGEGDEEDDIPEAELQQLRDHSDAVEGLIEALDGTDYPVDFSDLANGMQEVGLRLADAHFMYDVANGKDGAAEALFNRILQFQGQQIHDNVLTQILEYAKVKGLIEGNEGEDTGVDDPVAQENKRLKEQLKNALKGGAQNTDAQRRQTIFNSAVTELERLATEAEVDEWTLKNVLVPAMASGVRGNKAIINRIARGNFIDIQRLYDEAMNHVNGRRVQTNNNKVAGRKARDRKVPKRVSGGNNNAHTPAAKPAFDLSTGEGRRAAAKASLRGQ